jgi:hypothetical protein
MMFIDQWQALSHRIGHANISTTRIYDRRRTRAEDSPTRWRRRQVFRTATAVLLVTLVSHNSFARELAQEGYIEYMNKGETEKSFVMNWLDGVYSGLGWANGVLEHEQKPPLFCPPKKMVVTSEQIKSILDDTTVRSFPNELPRSI